MSAPNPGIVSPLALVAGRVRHVEEMCRAYATESANGTGTLSDRAWLAQSVLNILHGNIDGQICDEVKARRKPLSERISRSHLRPL